MDAIVKNFPGAGAKPDVAEARPSQAEAEEAVRVLLRWAGENPAREGLLDTPKRVAKAYRELFAGYELNVQDVLGTTFEEVGGYDDVVLVRDIPSLPMRVKAAPEFVLHREPMFAVAAIWLFYSILARPMLFFRYRSR